jgi:protein-S-isoprenylcysteine O-methyltransferase Ste14
MHRAMNAEVKIAPELRPDTRPASAVSTMVGVAGLAGLLSWVMVARIFEFSGPNASLCAVVACAAPMLLWSLLVDRVHRNPTTGIDWDRAPRPLSETLDISLVKLTGLWATWAAIAFFYCGARYYWDGAYLFAMKVLGYSAVPLLILSIPYVMWIDRRLREPRDGAWHFGQLITGSGAGVDRAQLHEHFRSWAIKAFFSAFMIAIVPGNWQATISPAMSEILVNPASLARWLISAMFMIDVTFATVGYVLTMKPLDAHIRSGNPYAAGWMAALICYPPFILMNPGGPLDYHPGTAGDAAWTYWLDGSPLLVLDGVVLVFLTGVYAWATMAFGIRFSNLTHRGILTHGPYAWTKHPAYVSKNLFWWLAVMPFLATTGSLVDVVRNSVILAAISGVYYWRARTEERHLGADPAYRAYAEWMERNAPLPRMIRKLRGGPRPEAVPAE